MDPKRKWWKVTNHIFMTKSCTNVESLGERYAVKSLHSCLQLGKVKINRYRLSDWNRRGSSHGVFSVEVKQFLLSPGKRMLSTDNSLFM
jgi:hypothetical protein